MPVSESVEQSNTTLGGQVPPLGLFLTIFNHTRLQWPLFPFSGSLSCAARLHSDSVTLLSPRALCSLLRACFLSLHSHLFLSTAVDQRRFQVKHPRVVCPRFVLLDLLLRQWLEAWTGGAQQLEESSRYAPTVLFTILHFLLKRPGMLRSIIYVKKCFFFGRM